MDIKLNQGQQDAADSFLHFLATDEEEMVISGPAGTGKSSLLGHLMKYTFGQGQALSRIMGNAELHDIRLTATTNKAADILSIYTGREVTTIHSALNLNIRNNVHTGEVHLVPAGGRIDDQIIVNELVVVEECSMINRELDHFRQTRTTNCKFLYLGDHCQLAPVGEYMSPVFQRGLRTANLTKVERSANAPPITDVCTRLRGTVEGRGFFEIAEVPGFIEYLDNAQMLAKIDEYFVQPNQETSNIVCFTNKRVTDFNNLIRKMRGLPNHLTKGETVVSNTSLEITRGVRINVEEEVKILDVDTMKIINFQGIQCYRVNTLYGWVTVPFDPAEVKKVMQQKAKDAKAGKGEWADYFAIKDNLADFRPVDARTVYKAQGSTYDNIFIDLGDIGTCNIANQVARMLYVAYSRPRSRVFLFGQLPLCYRGG